LPDAEGIAVDVDEQMLTHIRDKARAAGLAGRIGTVQADLDQAWPAGLKPADLVWAGPQARRITSCEEKHHGQSSLLDLGDRQDRPGPAAVLERK
jgi:hypothetical protein